MTMLAEYSHKREEYMDVDMPEKPRKEDVEFEKKLNAIYDQLWEMFSPGSEVYRNKCHYGEENAEKLHRIIIQIDKELGR